MKSTADLGRFDGLIQLDPDLEGPPDDRDRRRLDGEPAGAMFRTVEECPCRGEDEDEGGDDSRAPCFSCQLPLLAGLRTMTADSGRGLKDEDAPPPDFDAALEIEPDGFRIDPVLFDENAGGQGFLCVVLEDGYGGLEDDGAHVDLGGHEVDRAARKADAPVDGFLLDVEARE